jgi:hypothetical protein
MFKQFISFIPGADIFMITSLCIFMVFFVLVGLYLFWIDRDHVEKMSHLPFE